MPIDIDRFEQGSSEDLRSGGRTNAEDILSFLATHPEQAYTPKEIHEATDVAAGASASFCHGSKSVTSSDTVVSTGPSATRGHREDTQCDGHGPHSD